MTFGTAIACSVIRSAMIAVVGTFIAARLHDWLRSLSGATRRIAWGVLLVPFFTPALVTGYCYRDTAMALVHTPWLRELLYGVLVAAPSIPVAVLLLRFAPPPGISDTALYAARLYGVASTEGGRFPLAFRRVINDGVIWLRSRAQYRLAAAAVLFILSFQEAELATLMQAATWTEWMFTRHAGGLALSETLRLIALPVLIQIPFLIPVVLWIAGQRHDGKDQIERIPAVRGSSRIHCGVWLVVAVLLICLIPGWQLWRGARQGLPVLWEQPSLIREIGDALLLAVTAGAGGIGLGWMLLHLRAAPGAATHRENGSWASLMLLMLLLPGCLGNLALGLSLAAVFQTPWLRAAYDTPLPLVLGEILFLLPRTMILLTCVAALRTSSGEHLLRLLAESSDPRQRGEARDLGWKLTGRIWFAVAVLVCFWGYLEVMLPSTLAMPGMTPVGLVLYNALHYGRITALGAKLTLALAVPVVIGVGLLVLRRVIVRWGWGINVPRMN